MSLHGALGTFGIIIGLLGFTNNLFIIAKCMYATPDPVQPDQHYLCVHCVYPLVLLVMFNLILPNVCQVPVTVLPCLVLSHCCVTCSDPLMYGLDLSMNTYKQFYLMYN